MYINTRVIYHLLDFYYVTIFYNQMQNLEFFLTIFTNSYFRRHIIIFQVQSISYT